MSSKLENYIAVLSSHELSSYTVGPIYSSWLFSVNKALINATSKLVRLPDAEGVEAMPWDQDVSDDDRAVIANWLGVRNSIVDAMAACEYQYAPATIEDTYAYLLQDDPEDPARATAIRQAAAANYLERRKRGEQLFSPLPRYVEDTYQSAVRAHAAMRDVRDNVVDYLGKADYVKSRSSALDYGNLPEWFDEMLSTSTERKLRDQVAKKLSLLDRPLGDKTRVSIETEIMLIREVGNVLGLDVEPPKMDSASVKASEDAYLTAIGLAQ